MHAEDATGDVLYDGPAGVELRGRTSLTFPKPQYSVELREYMELPVWPGSTWRYRDDGADPLRRDAGRPSPLRPRRREARSGDGEGASVRAAS